MSSNNIVKRIRGSKALGKAKAGSLSALPQVDDPTLQRWIKSISNVVDDASKNYVRTQDLAKAGFIDKEGNIKVPDGSGGENTEGSTIVPKAVTNLTANGAYSSITLSWDTPQSKYFGTNEVYRSEVNDFGQAINIGSSPGNVYTDYIGNAAKAYYWVRTVSKFGIAGDISASAYAETSINIDYLVDQLTGQISEGTLSQALKGKIDLIAVNQENIEKAKQDAEKTKGETAQAINELITDIQTEQQDRIGEALLLQDGITTAQNTADDATEALTTYKESNDQALATVRQRVNVAVDDATTAINKTEALDGRVKGAEENTATALNQSQIAVDKANATAQQLYSVQVALEDKASTAYVNQVKATAEDAQGKANTNLTEITGLKGRVDNNESSISEVRQTKANKNEVVSITQQALQSIWQGDAQAKVDALVIGGRNYILDSKTSGDKNIATSFDFSQLVGKAVTISFTLQIKNKLSTIASRNRIGFELSFAVQGGTQYVGVWANDVTNYNVGTYVVSATMLILPTTRNPKMIYYYNQTSGINGTDFIVSNVKLEVGNKVTDWTPAPEDEQAALAAFQATVSNAYSTKADTNSAVASGIQQYDAGVSTSLPTEPDATKANQWLWTEITTANRADWGINTIPDYSWLRKAATVNRDYLADGSTMQSGWWTNTVLFFRTTVSVAQQKTINFGNFTGDDAHAIYVNNKKVFEKGSYGTTAVSFTLPAGVSVIDIAVSNGGGGAGFSAQNLLSGQVDWMRAPKSTELQTTSNASAINQTQVEVSNLNGQVSSLAAQSTTLTSTVNAIKNTGQVNSKAVIIDLTASRYEVGKAYPIGISLYYTRNTIRIFSTLDNLSHPTWGTHSAGFVLEYEWNVSPNGWGTRDINREISNASWGWTQNNAAPLIKLQQLTNSSIEVVWLRGGGAYRAAVPDNSNIYYPDAQDKLEASGQVVYWHYYNEYAPPDATFQKTNSNTVTLTQQAQVINGMKALAMLQINNNGVVSGVGIASEMINGQVKSEIGFMADRFFFESPQGKVYPMVINGNQTVINDAVIRDGSINNAKIGSLAADKITSGDISADRMRANIVQAAQGRFDSLSVLSANMGRFESYKAGVGRGVIEGPNIWLYDTAGVNRIFIGLGD